jgi:hypothetical protein
LQPQPYQEVQPRQSRPQLKEVKPERSQQHREAGPQSRKAAKPQHSQQQQGNHNRGEVEKQD